jgi:hypothetical protein
MPTRERLSLAEELYLVLHYDPVDGSLLRNGKVNGSETQVLSAATLVDLFDADIVERTRTRAGEALVAQEEPVASGSLEAARAVLAGQRKQRGIVWALGNLGSVAPVIERLVCSECVLDERKPAAALLPRGIEVLRDIRTALDALVLGDATAVTGGPDRIWTLAAILGSGKVWRNVWSAKERSERDAITDRLAFVSERVVATGGSAIVVRRLGEIAVAA